MNFFLIFEKKFQGKFVFSSSFHWREQKAPAEKPLTLFVFNIISFFPLNAAKEDGGGKLFAQQISCANNCCLDCQEKDSPKNTVTLIFKEISSIMFFRILENRKSSIVMLTLLNSIPIREAKKWKFLSFLFRPLPKRGSAMGGQKNVACDFSALQGNRILVSNFKLGKKTCLGKTIYIQTRDKEETL